MEELVDGTEAFPQWPGLQARLRCRANSTAGQGSPGHTEQHSASCLLAPLERISTFQLFSLVLILHALS